MTHTFGRHIGAGRGNVNGGRQLPPNMPTQDTVNGDAPLYLHDWMRQCGLADILPSWRGVYMGLSVGSLVMPPRIGQEFAGWTPPTGGGDAALGLMDFAIYPHLDHPELPENTMANAVRWAANMPLPRTPRTMRPPSR